ncbi:MAG TPA: HAMP domain-containing sensor histidine kinase [Nitrospirota bacterium]|nr:HAMP domain-containing sensor histidine kinase [Nitrospirota bacterium]
MNTAQDKSPPFRNKRSLSPVCSPSHAKGAALDTMRQGPAKPDWLKSPVIIKATREAGLTLYEILGMAELMRVAYEKGEIEILHSRLALLLSQAGDLSSALTNILELSKLETEQATITCQYFDIVALLQDVSHAARLSIGQKPVKVMDVDARGPVTILSDPGNVRKIMMGLISNAAKFTDRGRIALILNKDEYNIRLIITDTGRGMTAEQMNAAFAPSDIRVHAEKNDHAVSWLGLRTIRNLVKLLEGSITVSSKVGEGTIVEVSLPIEPSESITESCRRMGNELPCACDGLH